MANSNITLSIESLQAWADELTITLERSNNSLKNPEFKLDDVQRLIETCYNHSNLLDRLATLIDDHRSLLHDAEDRQDEILRGRGMDPLPVEVLRYIFQLACSSTQDPTPANPKTSLRNFWGDRCTTRFQIVQVNRYWREVGLSIPQLWSTVMIYPHTSPKLISFLIQSSGSQPMNVILLAYMYDLRHPYQTSEAAAERLVDLYLPISSRCQVFGIDYNQPDICVSLVERLASPTWRELYLACGGSFHYLDLPIINAPDLSVLSSQDHINLQHLGLGAQLTTVDLACHLGEVLPILKACPNLSIAKLHVPQTYESEELSSGPIFHQSLKVLHLGFDELLSWIGIILIVQHLSSPSLETLILSFYYDGMSPDCDTIKSSLNGTQGHPFGLANVKTLIYDFQKDHSNGGYLPMLHLLTKFSNLERLECREIRLAILMKTFHNDTLQLIPPRLQTLVLHKSYLGASGGGYDRQEDTTVSGAAAVIVEFLAVLSKDRDIQVIFDGALADKEREIRQEMMRMEERAGLGSPDVPVISTFEQPSAVLDV